MNSLEHAIRDLLRQREQAGDERRWADDTQIGIRVGPDVVAGVDALASRLGISRSALSKHILSAGIYDALKVAGMVVGVDHEGNWYADDEAAFPPAHVVEDINP